MNISDENSQFAKMTETPIKPLVAGLAVPTIISMLVTSVYNTADTFFVSKLGTSASGAIGIVFSLMAVIQAVGFTLGMGSGSAISRLLGQRKNDEADCYASSGLAASAVFGLLLGITGLLTLEPLMRLLGSTETILPYAAEYGKYILISAPFMTMTFVLNNILRSEGKARLSMIGLASGSILNIGLDPLMIFVFDMGITGAAAATLIGNIISFCILLYFFLAKKTTVRLSVQSISRSPMLYLKIIRNGLPSFCRQGLASISTVMLNNAAAYYGDAAVAAISIVGKIFMLIFSVILGFGQGYQPVAGFNYGAGKYKRVKEALMFNYITATIMMTVLAAGGFIFAPQLMELFIKDDPQVIETGALALRIQCLSMPMLPITTTSNMTFQSIGKSWTAVLLSSCRQGIYFIPLILILPDIYGLNGVISVQTAADVLSAATSLPFLIWFVRKLGRENQQ